MAPSNIIFWEVDAQADFMLPGGELYVPGAEKLIPNIQRLVTAAVDSGSLLIASSDAHRENDPEFETFPPHCLRGTPGAQIIPEGTAKSFHTVPNDISHDLAPDILNYRQIVLQKQTLDVFDNAHAIALIERLGSDAEYVVFGVVTEYCVRCAAIGLLKRGRKVAIVTDAIEALNPEDGRRTLEELQSLGALLTTTDEVIARVRARVTVQYTE